jgi:CheY-like chemotaxis protein
MSHVVLVHWHETEAAERAATLRTLGHDVQLHWEHDAGGQLTRALAAHRPDAIVIDLGRLPAHGRAVATWVREKQTLRTVPLVFVPGDAAKTARLRAAFPDATYAPWPKLAKALAKAIATPVVAPVVPKAPDYSGTPLPQKLGLKPGGALATRRAPHDFAATLGDLPAGATRTDRLAGEREVIVLFCRALAELRADWPAAVKCLAERGSLWVAWPKRASGVTTDLTDNVVRAFGLDRGLVDTKVCAIDATWSGLRFSRRAAKAGKPKAGKG